MWRTVRFALQEYRRSLNWLLLGGFALLAGTACQVILPLFIKLAVDALGDATASSAHPLLGGIAGRLVGEPAGDVRAYILRCLAWGGLIAAVLGVFTFAKRWYLVRISRRTEYELKKEMYAHLQLMPSRWYDSKRSGGITSLMTSDIEAIRMMIGPALMYLGGTVTTVPASLAVMFQLNTNLTWLALLPMVGLTAATVWFSPRVRKHTTRAQETLEDLSARAQENFAGARVVKAFGRESFEVAQLDTLGDAYLHHKLGVARNQSGFQACIWGFSGLGVLILLWFGASEIAAGRFTTGDFAAFSLYNVQLYWPMIALGWVTMLFVRASASLKRVDELLRTPPDPTMTPGAELIRPAEIRGEIEFRGVGLRYNEHGPAALEKIDFHVSPGRTLGLVGQVGSGKSSVANLLLGMLPPTAGEIRIDSRSLDRYDLRALRGFFGYVPQDSFLFSETVGENIGLSLPGDVTDRTERTAEAAKIAHIDGEIADLADGFDTLLGERGVNLSGGQKQRTAIARALARRPRILVLDDCLSAVDTHTEAEILRGLREQTSDITCIIVAQRISAVAHADEILVLDRGRVVERGTDRELRESGGFYADLARRQQIAEEITANSEAVAGGRGADRNDGR